METDCRAGGSTNGTIISITERKGTMNQNLEIEFKNMLTKEEFIRITNHFQLSEEHFITQENHYFDTPSFSLKEKGSALRIRKKKGCYEMTLKQPHPNGLLESNERLDEEKALAYLHNKQKLSGKISELIENMGVSVQDIVFFGTLTTKRAEIQYRNGLLVVDHSFYLGVEDFELEYEVTDEKRGYEDFLNLLKELHIPLRKTENKIKRFYKQKFELEK